MIRSFCYRILHSQKRLLWSPPCVGPRQISRGYSVRQLHCSLFFCAYILTIFPQTTVSQKDVAFPIKPGQSRKRIISTLHPDRLQPRDFMDLSSLKLVRLHTLSETSQKCFTFNYHNIEHGFGFPEKCHGFLYCHSIPNIPPDLWTLRFRLTENNDPASFASGVDLLRNDDRKRPWSIPVTSIALRDCAVGLRNLLVQDNLVDPHIFSELQTLVDPKGPNKQKHWFVHGRPLRSLDQPFPIDLDCSNPYIFATHGGLVNRITMEQFYKDQRKGVDIQPYSGKLLGVVTESLF